MGASTQVCDWERKGEGRRRHHASGVAGRGESIWDAGERVMQRVIAAFRIPST